MGSLPSLHLFVRKDAANKNNYLRTLKIPINFKYKGKTETSHGKSCFLNMFETLCMLNVVDNNFF